MGFQITILYHEFWFFLLFLFKIFLFFVFSTFCIQCSRGSCAEFGTNRISREWKRSGAGSRRCIAMDASGHDEFRLQILEFRMGKNIVGEKMIGKDLRGWAAFGIDPLRDAAHPGVGNESDGKQFFF